MKKQFILRSFSVGGAHLYNELVRRYNRSQRKFQRLAIEGKNLRKQGILIRRIVRLFKTLTGMQRALKLGMATAALSAGMLLFQANAVQAQAEITFGAVQINPFGLTDIGSYSAPAFADLDGDGDMDMMAAEYLGNFIYFQNSGTALGPAFSTAQTNPFGLMTGFHYPAPAFADLDGDGDMDMMAGDDHNSFHYFQNTGTAAAPAFAAEQINPFGLTDIGFYYNTTLAFADLDGDGDMDMMAEFSSGFNAGSFHYWQNTGTAAAPAFGAAQTNPFGLTNIGIAPAFADLDSDGDMDMIAGDLSGNFFYFQNIGTAAAPAFGAAQTNPFGLTGGAFPLAFTDLNGDGDMDLMAGEYNGDFHYFENTTLCNGLTVYADADGDSYGDATNTYFAADCIAPSGYVYDSTDCNDSNTAIHPGACDAGNGNSVDDNCDGVIDDGYGATIYYADVDGDGYGAGIGTSLCSNPGAGFSTNNTDCNDVHASIHPDACDGTNHIDDNCNGVIDDGSGAITYYLDADNDGYGAGIGNYMCRNPGTGFSTNHTDCNDAHASVNPGATEIINGIDDNCNGIIDDVVCLVPTNLYANVITATSATLKWDVFNVDIHYIVRYKIAGTPGWTNIQSIDNDKTLHGLAASTKYAWQVKSFCGVQPIVSSYWSEKQFFTTDALRLAAMNETMFEVYPNPVSQSATVSFSLNEASPVVMEIMDVNGRSLKVIANADFSEGNHEVYFHRESLIAGIYFLQLTTNERVMMKKMIIE